MKTLFDRLRLANGQELRNRFFLAPLTNQQSLADGSLSEAEYQWLRLRTEGGFAATMTCAAGVQENHATMPGQLGIFHDRHIDPLRPLAAMMKANGNLALMQINHGGLRADARIVGQPVGPYDEPEWGGRALSTPEIQRLVEDFILAARRAEEAGFDGVEIHGGHGQILNQFLNPLRNLRNDGYGGSLQERSRIFTEILDGIRARCRPGFVVGLRLSVERFEIKLGEFRELSGFLMTTGRVDFMDFSLWSVFKEPVEEEYKGKPLIAWAMDIPRGKALVGVAGKITDAATAQACITAGADFVSIGRGAIIHYDFPKQVAADPNFRARALPVSVDYLHAQGVSDPFIGYLRQWDGFVADAGRGMYTDEADMVDGSSVAICFSPEELAAQAAAPALVEP